MRNYVFILALTIIISCNLKTNKDKNSTPLDSQRINSESNTIEKKYVIAFSGLNYREKPKGNILGKFSYGTELEIAKHTAFFEHVKDSSKTLKGEWLAVKVNQDTVYVFDAYLSLNKPLEKNIEFKYSTELCDCKAKFDSKKYTKKQLQNTLDYLWHSSGINYDATVWKFNEIRKLDVSALKAECDLKINQLETLDFADTPFLEQIKRRIFKLL